MFTHSRLRFVAAVLILLLMTSLVAAQEDVLTEATPEVTEEPVIVVEPTPVPEITEEATAAPTDEPTAIPTEITPEVTDEPQEGGDQPTPEETDAPEETTEPEVPTPDIISAPPVFEIASSFSAQAGQPLRIAFAIYDEQGAAIITEIVSAVGAQTSLEITAPIQTSPPFVTTGTIIYTAAETFSGADTLTLTAVDGAGTSATTTVQVDVQPMPGIEVTEEATPEATAEVTPEATAEATAEAIVEATAERILSYDPAASEESIQAMLAALQATEISRIPQLGLMKVLMPQALADPAQALAAIQGNQAAVMAGVITVEENIAFQLDAQVGVFNPNDPQFRDNTQWALRNGAGGINGQDAWTRARNDGVGVLVAVLDTGVDLHHPDLKGQLDLTRAWDFINNDNNPDDDHAPASGPGGHGTHVAGIIAARTNNALNMAGIAYRAKIVPIKVCEASNGCPVFEVAQGIVHAVDRGVRIINLSLSGPTVTTTMQAAVQYAISRNVIVVAAAGNTGNSTPQYPASFPNVISVAAHDIDGDIAPTSTQNSSVDVSAPGVDVYSLVRTDWDNVTTGTLWSGTSAAAAHVSGIAALLWADNIARTPATVREALVCSAVDAGAPGFDNAFGFGIVRADRALIWRATTSTNCEVPLVNDRFAGALLIRKAPFAISQLVHSRSVTTDADDPTDCGTPVQTLWYRFVPPVSRRYQIISFGSSYSTRLAVYQGIPGEFTRQDNCGAQWSFNSDSFISLDMKQGQSYYIVLSTSGSPVNDQTALLNIRPTLSANGAYDDSNPAFAYHGLWTRITAPNRAKAIQTDNNGSLATFTFQGTMFDLYRVVGPAQGAIEVWINGQRYDFDPNTGGVQNLDNRATLAAVLPQTITIPLAFHGEQQTIIIKRAETGPSGPVAFDRIVIFNTILKVFTGKIDNRDPRIDFGNAFWDEAFTHPLMFRGTGARTNRAGAAVRAVVKGSTIIIYRNIGPNFTPTGGNTTDFGSMEIYVDGVLWETVNNNHPTYQYSVPIAITNLTPTAHSIRIINTEARELQIDAIQGAITPTIPVNRFASPGDARILRSGLWDPSVLVTSRIRAFVNSSPTARMDFNFSGNAFCIAFVRRDDGGTMHVFVDDMTTPHARVSTHTNPNQWAGHFWPPDMLVNLVNIQQYCTGAAFAEGVHHVRLTFPSGEPVWLTQLQFGRFGILTAAAGLVQENDGRLPTTETLYSTRDQSIQMAALWRRITGTLLGGFKAQGGYLKRATLTGTPPDPVIRFYMHGSGFIIYTSRGPNAGVMQVRVCRATSTEDCTPAQLLVNGSNQNGDINLFLAGAPRPFVYAVTGLEPGIYLIKISAEGNPGQYVDFDAVRILP